MNRLQLVNRLKLEAGVSGNDLTSTIAQTGESARLVTWIDSAWYDIQGQHEDWQWMRKTATFPTVSGVPVYSISRIGLADFGNWARDSFRNYANPAVTVDIASPGLVNLTGNNLNIGDTFALFTTGALPTGITAGTNYYVLTTGDSFTFSATAGGVAINTTGTQSGEHSITSSNALTFSGFRSEIMMDYMEYESWRNNYEFGSLRQTQSRPFGITITPDKSIGLYPFPINGYTVLGDYFAVPSNMTLDADIPSLPVQYHMAIVYRALMFYAVYESAGEGFSYAQMEFDRIMRRVSRTNLPEVFGGSALA